MHCTARAMARDLSLPTRFLTRATEDAIARHPPEVPWFVDGKLSPQTGPPRDGGKSLLLGCYMPTNTSHRQSSFWASRPLVQSVSLPVPCE